MEQQRRGQIREAFFGPLLVAAHAPGETATAFLGRQEEKARLLAPYLARLQSELLEPLVQRTFGVLYRAGALPRYTGSALHPEVPVSGWFHHWHRRSGSARPRGICGCWMGLLVWVWSGIP